MSDMQIINHVLAFLTNRFGAFCHVTIDDAVNTIAAVDPVSADELDRLRVEVETLRAQMHGMQDGSLVRDQAAEIDRLRAERELALAIIRRVATSSFLGGTMTQKLAQDYLTKHDPPQEIEG